jgi:S1-C subfamily serine protease/lipid-binding SYLF domain-containing protein
MFRDKNQSVKKSPKDWSGLRLLTVFAFIVLSQMLSACASTGSSANEIDVRADNALSELEKESGEGMALLAEVPGYLVFPNVVKAGLGIGAESGKGVLRVGRKTVDYYRMSSGSIGLQLGIQSKSVIIAFRTLSALEQFRHSDGWQAGVDGSIAVANIGAGRSLDMGSSGDPVVGIVFGAKGLMYNLTLEGTKITKLDVPVETLPGQLGTATRAKADLEYYSSTIEKLANGGRSCDVGILSRWDNYITRVSDKGAFNGLNPGDKILSLNGEEITPANLFELLSKYDPGDELVLAVRRGSKNVDVRIVCGDATEVRLAKYSMIQAAADSRWQDCIDQSYTADRIRGAQIAFSATYRLNCNEVNRCGYGRCPAPDRTDAEIWYTARVRALEEAAFADDKLTLIRADVLTMISSLEKAGYPRLANDLESQLEAADAATPATAAGRATPSQTTTSYGSCFAVSDSEILTSNHVVTDADSISVRFEDGIEREAVISQRSQSNDLALLKIGGKAPAHLSLAPVRSLEVGQQIFTIGYPVTSILGTEAKFTEGSVSALSGIQGDASYFQMSVPVQPGNSGGPVVNMKGEVVGIVAATAAIEAFYASSGALPQNVNWASKSDSARLLFSPSSVGTRAGDRRQAIQRAKDAACQVSAIMN